MSQSDKRQELAALAKSLRETATRLRKAAKLIVANEAHELLKTSRATLASQLDEASTNGKPVDDVKVKPAKPKRKSSAKAKQDKPAKSKKRTRK
jgi:hypothetical protein